MRVHNQYELLFYRIDTGFLYLLAFHRTDTGAVLLLVYNQDSCYTAYSALSHHCKEGTVEVEQNPELL